MVLKLENKEKLENGEITLDDLSLEEIEEVNKLYKYELAIAYIKNKKLKEEISKLKEELKED